MSATLNKKLKSIKADCKYHYKANINLFIGYLKYRLPAMLLFADKAFDICKQLLFLSMKHTVPIIKGRSVLNYKLCKCIFQIKMSRLKK